jgi:hypothetical protein
VPGFFRGKTNQAKCLKSDTKLWPWCFTLRRPWVWISLSDPRQQYSEFNFIRVPNRDMKGPQSIDGLPLLRSTRMGRTQTRTKMQKL